MNIIFNIREEISPIEALYILEKSISPLLVLMHSKTKVHQHFIIKSYDNTISYVVAVYSRGEKLLVNIFNEEYLSAKEAVLQKNCKENCPGKETDNVFGDFCPIGCPYFLLLLDLAQEQGRERREFYGKEY